MLSGSFLRNLLPHRPAQPLRVVVSTKAEDRLAQRKRADLRMELEIMAVHMTPEERSAARDRGAVRCEAEQVAARVRAKASIRRRAKRAAGAA